MTLVKCVIHIVSDVIHNALIYLGNSGLGGERFLGFNDGILKSYAFQSTQFLPLNYQDHPLK